MTKILLLGVFHFTQQNFTDILSANSQKQLRHINICLAEFNPDAIMVEAPYHQQNKFDEGYQLFNISDLSDTAKMKNETLGDIYCYGALRRIKYANEYVQIGFRLGKTLGLQKIHAVDYDSGMEDVSDLMTDYQKRLRKKYFDNMAFRGVTDDIVSRVLFINTKNYAYNDHQIYLSTNSINAGTTYEGAMANAQWYERNLKIFANIQKICESSERALVIYGCGHVTILRDLIKACENMTLVEAGDVITPYAKGDDINDGQI